LRCTPRKMEACGSRRRARSLRTDGLKTTEESGSLPDNEKAYDQIKIE
jgi:hypothetical protein